MENRKIPALIALAGVIVVIVVFFAFGDDDTSENTELSGQPETSATESVANGDEDKPEKPKKKADKPAEPEVPSIEIEDGEPVGGVQEIEVTRGDELRVNITTDAADELHLHGFDVYLDIVPGKTNELVVDNADIDGILELESHSTGALLAEISVVPD